MTAQVGAVSSFPVILKCVPGWYYLTPALKLNTVSNSRNGLYVCI